MATLSQVQFSDPAHPRSFNSRLDRDLETICLKCLEKNPRHRYPSASALAEDLESWLAGKPIAGRRHATWERGFKWVRRQPIIVPVSVFVAALAIGFALATFSGRTPPAAPTHTTPPTTVVQPLPVVDDPAYERAIAEAWKLHKAGKDNEALEELAKCDEASRAWEWYYLNRLLLGQDASFVLKDKGQRSMCLAFSHDGMLANSAVEGEVLVWSVGNRKLLQTLKTATAAPVAFHPKDPILATSDGKKNVLFYDTSTWRPKTTLNCAAMKLSFSRDGRFLASVGPHYSLSMWESGKEKPLWEKPMDGEVTPVFAPDGTWFVAGINGRTKNCVATFETMSGAEQKLFPTNSFEPWNTCLSPDGKRVAYTGVMDGTIRILDLGEMVLAKFNETKTLQKSLRFMGYTPDGRRLIGVSYAGEISIWNPENRHLLLELPKVSQHDSMAISPEGDFLGFGSDNGVLILNGSRLK